MVALARRRRLKQGKKSHSRSPLHFAASGTPTPIPHPGKESLHTKVQGLMGHRFPLLPPLGASRQYGPPPCAPPYACAWELWGKSLDPVALKRTSSPPNHTRHYLSREPSPLLHLDKSSRPPDRTPHQHTFTRHRDLLGWHGVLLCTSGHSPTGIRWGTERGSQPSGLRGHMAGKVERWLRASSACLASFPPDQNKGCYNHDSRCLGQRGLISGPWPQFPKPCFLSHLLIGKN